MKMHHQYATEVHPDTDKEKSPPLLWKHMVPSQIVFDFKYHDEGNQVLHD